MPKKRASQPPDSNRFQHWPTARLTVQLETNRQKLAELKQADPLWRLWGGGQGPVERLGLSLQHDIPEIETQLILRKSRSISKTGLQAPPPSVNTSAKPSEPPALEKLPAKKQDLSSYLDRANLTDKQRDCFSLKFEYELTTTEIASRLGCSRANVDEHIAAAGRKLKFADEKEKAVKNKAKSDHLR